LTIKTGDEYIESLRKRKVEVYLFGEKVKNPVDHLIISSNCNIAPNRREDQSIHSHTPEHSRPSQKSEAIKVIRSKDGCLFPAMRWDGLP